MRHGQHTEVMVLVFAVQFAIDIIPWASTSYALRASPLRNKPGDNSVKFQAVVEAFFGKFDEICNRFGSVFFKKKSRS
jgi:hypothetical protein